MLVRVSIERRSLVIVLVAAGLSIVIAAGLALIHPKNTHEQAQATYYGRQLDQLKHDASTVDALNKREGSKVSLSDQISAYQARLASILDTCQKMDEHFGKAKADPAIQSLKSSMEQAHQLCMDAEKVTAYARLQSQATEGYILFPGSSLTNPDTAQAKILELQGTLTTTEAGLEKLKSNPISDPAIDEQIVLLRELQKLSQAAASDPAKLSELARTLHTHQNDFLNARTYFWNNTVGLYKLQAAIATLQTDFK